MLLSTKNLRLKARPGKLRPLYVGPYQVLKAVGRNAFKLQLPPALKVHPVFNVALLKPYFGDHLVPAEVEIDGVREYEVEAILRHRGRPRHYQYLVHWRGYDASEDMWLPEEELQNAGDVLREYKLSRKLN